MSLTEAISRDMKEPGVAGVAGVYWADGTYSEGRPVFRHSDGGFTIGVWGGCWVVRFAVGDWEVRSDFQGGWYLRSASAPSMCPADPRAARSERRGEKHWTYKSKQGGYIESGDISVTCNNCIM